MKYKEIEYKYIDYDSKEGFIAVKFHINYGCLDILIPKDKEFNEVLYGVTLSDNQTKILFNFLKQYYKNGD